MGKGRRDSTEELGGAVAVLGVLYFFGAVLGRDPDFDAFFGVENFRAAGPVVLAAAIALLLLLFWAPGLSGKVVEVLRRAVSPIPAPLRLPLVLIGSAAAFWFLPTWELSGDAVPVILRTSLGEVYASNPLTSFLAIGISRVLSWPAVPAIRLLSCAAGVLYVGVAVQIARELMPAGPRRVAMVFVLVCCGTSALFFGSIEVYAPLTAFLGLYLLLGIRCIRRGTSTAWPALALGIAFTLHGSAGLLLPSLGFLANGCRIRPEHPGKVLKAGVLFLVPVAIVFGALYFLHWGGDAPEAAPERFGSFFGGNEQGPLLPLTLTPINVLYRYALLDAEHVVGVFNLILLAAPAGLALLLFGRRPRGAGASAAVFGFVAIAGLFLIAFPVFWNVNYPLRQDWDLFSPLGIPLVLLGGFAYLGGSHGPRRAVGAAALALFAFVPLIITNHAGTADRRQTLKDFYSATQATLSMLPKESTARREIVTRAGQSYLAEIRRSDPHGCEEMVDRALVLARSGSSAAEPLLRKVLEVEPENATALATLGAITNDRDLLLDALRLEPWRLPARMNLARIALAKEEHTLLDRAEAIHQLEAGLRRGGMHPLAGQALLELAELREESGQIEIAAALRELAARKAATPSRE